jgi:uncharacterized protein
VVPGSLPRAPPRRPCGTVRVSRVRFPSGDGECAGDLYLPGDPARSDPARSDPARSDSARSDSAGSDPAGSDPTRSGPAPVVILAHGIGAERSFGLEPFARRFTARGLASLVFDYRHFGGSSGEPRNLVSPTRQVEDYLSAMSFVRRDPRLDGSRIGLWGTSFSGGHVLVVAARRPDGLRAVVSQIPFVSGIASTLAYPLRYHLPAIALGIADRLGALLRLPRLSVPVVRRRGLALLASPDSHDGYMAMVDEGSGWTGRVPAGVFLAVLAYHPSRSAHRISAPTLLLAASEDAICPVTATRKVARRIPDARLEEFPIGHFDPYAGEWFEAVVAREAEFLEATLKEG